MHKRIQSDKPVVFSFQLQEKEGEKIDEIGQIFKSFQADQTIQFGTKTVKVEVLDIQDTTKKEEAKDLFRYL